MNPKRVIVPTVEPLVSTLLPPGLARRRALRAAGINLHIADFTAEERAVRGFDFFARRRPAV